LVFTQRKVAIKQGQPTLLRFLFADVYPSVIENVWVRECRLSEFTADIAVSDISWLASPQQVATTNVPQQMVMECHEFIL